MRRWGITQRLLALALAPGVIIGLALYGYFVHAQLKMIDQSLHERGLTMAQQLAPASEYGVISGNTLILAPLVDALFNQNDVVAVGIKDVGHEVILERGRIHDLGAAWLSGGTEQPAVLCYESNVYLIFCAPIRLTQLNVNDFSEGEEIASIRPVVGYVQVEVSTAASFKRRNDLIANALAITGVVLLVTGLLAGYVGFQISRPIVAMTSMVREVGRGNLDVKLQPDGRAELAALGYGINSMIDSLRAARNELRAQVDAATGQLRKTLIELEEKNVVLEEERRRAQAASLAKGQFLANMSHEIRTPLSGIIGMLELLEQTDLKPVQQTYVLNLMLAANALHTLLNDILDLSRIEAGKLQLIEQWFNPRTVLNEVVLLMAPSAHEKALDIICHPSADFPQLVSGDSLRLRQVLLNLVSNAIKFTDSGKIVVRAFPVRELQHGFQRMRFEVEDTGIGIAAEKQQQVFDSFTQVDTSNTRKYGGSGLGTTISLELVHLMGGQMGLQSEEGRGSLFWFELPWEVRVAAGPMIVVPELAGRSVLILGRCAEERSALRDMSRALGLEVYEAADEAEARRSLSQHGGELVVLLVENTPEGSWLGFAHEARVAADVHLCHVTFFNGKTEFGLFDGYLNKPVMAESLREMLRGLYQVEASAKNMAGVAVVPLKSRVLVAEDNHINALVIKSFLEQAGHFVKCVGDGAEALAALQQEPFDMVFMDMRMPRMDGVQAARLWRAEEADGRHVPIIALTANATVEDREQCLAAGMDDFLAKPVTQELVLATMHRFLHVSRSVS